MKKVDPVRLVGVVANLGVLAGIVFLAVEVRQNTRSMEVDAYEDVVAQIIDASNIYVLEPERMEEIWLNLRTPRDELSQFEATRTTAYVMNLLRHGSLVYLQYQRGVIREETMRSGLTIISTVFCTPFVREVWAPTISGAFDVEYALALEERFLPCPQ